jgi:tagaturonate reductase
METSKLYDKNWYEANHGTLTPLPEKVLQFGTGVLLRGLPDYFINKANKKGIFEGSVVVVKSTSNGDVIDFEKQNNLYHHIIKGVVAGKEINELHENTSISRVLVATSHWREILQVAESSELKIVISNTTEAGLIFDPSDTQIVNTPSSFPGKLLAILWHRWNHFKNKANENGLIILPTELIPNNGELLKKIIIDLSTLQQLPNEFIQWLNDSNDFCNTLVDRIVTGNLPEKEQKELEAQLGYQDNLLITSEPFALWAIETSRQSTVNALSFSQVDDSVIVAPSIAKFRELKLRLLNGAHTFCCALAILAGFETVKSSMSNRSFYKFIVQLLEDEIALCVLSDDITIADTEQFIKIVLDRFSNPNMEHQWKSIAMNYTEKIKMRNLVLIDKYISLKNKVPIGMSICIAAFFVYQKQINQSKVDIEFTYDIKFKDSVNNLIPIIEQNGIMWVINEFVNYKTL